ncbi:MAG TPA: GNAT family N-acetyltransferase [Alphaproteobacteria bacterium]|nr:GNAT family N-acetyltransferase [Alphaproteobacteria bacterium]
MATDANDNTSDTGNPGGKLNCVVTYLEMRAPPRHPNILSGRHQMALMRAAKPTVSFYRYLYSAIGEAWLWWERRALDDEALASIIHDPQVEIYVLYYDGVPAGYAELDLRVAKEVEIAYFGLVPEFVGRGLGAYLLGWALDEAWRREPGRVWLHTCNFDHPKAIAIYQQAGFTPYRQETTQIDDPRLTGVLPAELPLPNLGAKA